MPLDPRSVPKVSVKLYRNVSYASPDEGTLEQFTNHRLVSFGVFLSHSNLVKVLSILLRRLSYPDIFLFHSDPVIN